MMSKIQGLPIILGKNYLGSDVSIQKYIEKIQNISKENIENIAKNVAINTIYFLKN